MRLARQPTAAPPLNAQPSMPKPNATRLPVPPARWIPTRTRGVQIALWYAALGTLWILCSGWVLHRLVQDPELEALIENVKGWCFVVVTAVLLGAALSWYFQAIRHSAGLLQESESRLRVLGDNLPDGYVYRAFREADGTPRFSYISAGAERVHGVTAAEALRDANAILRQTDPAQLAALTAAEAESAQRLSDFDMELRIRRADGAQRLVQVKSHPSRDEQGRVRWDGFVVDITGRKQAEEALRESQEKYRLLVENAREAIYVVQDGRIRFVNAMTCQMVGHSEAQLLGSSILDFVRPEDRREVEAHHRRLLEGEITQSQREYRLPDGPAGAQCWFVSAVRIVWNGQPATLNFASDISERKWADAILQARLRLLEMAATHTLEELLVATLDEAEALTSSQVGFYHFLEADERTLALQAWSTHTTREMCRAEGKGRHYDLATAGIWADCIRQRQPVVHNDYAALPDARGLPPGHAAVVRELTVPVFRSQRVVAILGVGNKPSDYNAEDVQVVARLADLAWDIVEHKQAKAALQLSEERYRELIQNQGEGVSIVDLEERFTFCNPAAEAIFGVPAGALVGRTMHEFTTPASLDRVQQGMQQLRRGERNAAEFEIVRPDGKTRWVLLTAVPRRDATGQLIGSFGIFRDITGRKATESSLHAARQQLRELNATLERRVQERTCQLAESEQRFRVLYESTHDAIITTDVTGACLDCNLAAVRMFGYPDKAALVAGGILALSPARQSDGRDSRAALTEYLAQILARGGWSFEWDHQRADGTVFPSEVSIGLAEVAGQPTLHGIVRDISQRKLAAERLCESQQRYRDLVDTAPDWVWEVDEHGFYSFSGPQSRALLGYEPEELLGRTPFDLMDPEEAERMTRIFKSALERREPLRALESVLRRKDGSLVTLETNGGPIVDVHGRLRGYRGLDHDITDRKRAEAQLHKLQSAVEQSPAAVVITDKAGIIEYVNPSFEALTGYTAAEALGQRPRLLKSGVHPPAFYEHLWGTLLAGSTWRGEMCNRRKDGTQFWELAAIAPIRDSAGRLTHFVAIKEDITERQRLAHELRAAKEAAEAANRAKSQFLANMSHEIRTPMNAILGFTQLLLRHPEMGATQRRQLATIGRSGEHLLAIINDILEMARIESGRIALNPTLFDLPLLLDDVERMFALRAQNKDLRFAVERSADLPRNVLADQTKLRQILLNLLSNAVKFTHRGGRIVLRVDAQAEPAGALCLRAEVEDTGAGIAAEDLPQMFQPFFQTNAGKQVVGGTGLGLAISREFARLMGGDITVKSRPGEGSTFQVDVRFCRSDADATTPGVPVRRALHLLPGRPACRVLVADDEPDNRDLLEQLLAPVGFEIRLARNGEEALAQCQAWQPHLALLDLRMPGMDGFEAARRIRAAHGSAVKILALSATVFAEDHQRALAAGADRFLGKPYREADLLDQIKQLTDTDYVYDEGKIDEPAETAEQPMVGGFAAALGRLPGDLVDRLRQATTRAEYAEMLVLVEQVGTHDAALARRLRQWVAEFDYNALHSILAQHKPRA